MIQTYIQMNFLYENTKGPFERLRLKKKPV